MKSAIVEREAGDQAAERSLLEQGIARFPTFPKLYLMLGQLEERCGNAGMSLSSPKLAAPLACCCMWALQQCILALLWFEHSAASRATPIATGSRHSRSCSRILQPPADHRAVAQADVHALEGLQVAGLSKRCALQRLRVRPTRQAPCAAWTACPSGEHEPCWKSVLGLPARRERCLSR